jgi:hypothetical protein
MCSTSLGSNQIQLMLCSILVNLSRIFWPSYILLQISLCILNINVCKVFTNFFIYRSILIGHGKCMPKASALITFWLHVIILEKIFGNKKIDKCSNRWIWFFLHVVFPLFFTIDCLLPPWIFFPIIKWFAYFFQCCYSTCCIIYDYIFFAWDLRLQNKVALM